MAADGWLGVALGAGIGLAYSLARHLTVRLAAGRQRERFMAVFVGGLTVRLLTALMLAAAVLAFASVPALPFLGALLVTFLAGLAADVAHIHRGDGLQPPDGGTRS